MSSQPNRTRVLSAADAAALVRSHSTLTISGVVGSLVPDATLAAIRERFDTEKEPSALDVVFPVAVGDVLDCPGLDRLADPRMLRRVIGGSFVYGTNPETKQRPALTELILEGGVEAYNFPIGVLFGGLRELAARRPGFFTQVGLGTFQDPRQLGGRLNEASSEGLVELTEIDGVDVLRYRVPKPDLAIIRGSLADEFGNVSMSREAITGGVFVQALAARSGGGTVIVEVERLVAGGSIPPRQVTIPGALVDGVVVAPGQQATGTSYDPFLSGELRVAERTTDASPDGAVGLILDRVSARLRSGDLVILGFGIPSRLPEWPEVPAGVRFTVEHGPIGGRPAGGLQFGGAFDAEAVIDTPAMFDLIDGGICDAACLGFAEIGPGGIVNVSRLPSQLPGSGGFTNITSATRRLIFCGTFTAGGLILEVGRGGLEISKEGRFRKLVAEPRHHTFDPTASGAESVTYVTDRCVMELRDGLLTVTEVYPGIDLERDILGQAEIELAVAL